MNNQIKENDYPFKEITESICTSSNINEYNDYFSKYFNN